MVGFRTEKYYLDTFGVDEGRRRYVEVVRRREVRERRRRTGRTIVLDRNNLEAEIKVGNAVRCMACGAIHTALQWRHFKTKCTVPSVQEYRRLYPDAPLKAANLVARTSITMRNMVAAYGEEVGTEKWDEYCKKQAATNTLEYKAKKYGWTEEQFDTYNNSRAVTISNLIQRHGEEEGLRIWEEYCDQQRYTNTLDYFIEREGGAEKGKEAWRNYNYTKGSSRRIPDIAWKWGISIDEACAMLSSRQTDSCFVSHAEMNFVDELERQLGWQFKYTYKTRQFCIWSHGANRPFFYDACCSTRNKIIEYHGDYWHARPTRYAADYLVAQRGLLAEQIWHLDNAKYKAAEDRGFQMRVVWETDYQQNGITQELKDWLNSP